MMELTWTELGKTVGVNRTVVGEEVGHMWKESQEFNLKHARFEMTIRHLSGNIELSFGPMKTEVWSGDMNWWLIGIFKAMKSSNERQKRKGPKDWARGPSASGLGEREANTEGREQSGTRNSQAKKVYQREKRDHLCQRLLGAMEHVVQMV